MERNAKVNACRDLAIRAGRNISFDPVRFGDGLLDGLENGLRNFLGQLPEDVRDEYEDRYIEKYKEWLYALGRCFSQAITGAGGWDARVMRRHEKTNNAEKAALERLEIWCEKVIKRCNRQERLTGWAEVERLQDKLDGLVRSQEMMKAANKIVRSKKLAEVEKVDELVALGFNEETALHILDDTKGWWGAGFAPFELSNNNAKIKDTEAKIKRHAAMASKEDEVHTAPWGTLRIDYSDERYRFVFDGKPEQDVIDMLKKNAFKWSPANKAWQRQITPSARYAVDRTVEYLNTK